MTGKLPQRWTPDALEEWRQQEVGALQASTPEPESHTARLLDAAGDAPSHVLAKFLIVWILIGLVFYLTVKLVVKVITWPFRRRKAHHEE